MVKYFKAFLLISCLILIASEAFSAARSAWTLGGVAVSTASLAEDHPAIVANDSGGAIVSWQDYRNLNWDIYAQAVDSDGLVQWAQNGISISSAAEDQEEHVMVADGSNGAIIAWWDKRNGLNYQLYVQKIDSAGNIKWNLSGVQISSLAAVTQFIGNQFDISLISDGSGGAIITWVDERNSDRDVYAQKIYADGSIAWTEGGIGISTGIAYEDSPTAVSDTAGGAIIAWHDRRNGNWDIYANRISSTGVKSWPELQVFSNVNSDKANFSPESVMIPDGAGGAILSWQGRDSSNLYDIFAQRINSSGTLEYGGSNKTVCNAADHQLEPVIINSNLTGTCIIAWRDFREESYVEYPNTPGDVYCIRMEADGTVDSAWASNGLQISGNSDAQEHIRITTESSGGAVLSWQDKTGGLPSIYAQKVDVNGSVNEWLADVEFKGTNISTGTYEKYYPDLVSDGVNGAIVCWGDGREGTYNIVSDIYVQRVTAPDTEAPEALTTLTGITGSRSDEIVLTWIAPHEDGPIGSAAQSYIIKYSTNPVAEPVATNIDGWWDNIALEYEQDWTPSSPGVLEQKSVYISGGNTYEFIVRAVDDANNKALLGDSNISTATARADTSNPSKISSLSADTGSTEGKIGLSWTSPLDNDGNNENALFFSGTYLVQYATFTSVTWSTTTANITQPFSEQYFGSSEAAIATGLEPGSTYYFKVWTADEASNLSLVSNVSTACAQMDITSPGVVTDLSSYQVSASSTEIKLIWTSPGDDGYVNYSTFGPVGFTGSFNIYYSSNSISFPVISDAQIVISTSNVYPGIKHSKTITGLEDDKLYNFVIWTYDENSNLSSYSLVASTKTLDLQAPEAITDLSASPGSSEGEINLSWSAPGDNGNEGQASGYELRVTTISPFNWSAVVLSTNIWTSYSPTGSHGTMEDITLTGLANGTTYYIEIRSYDEIPNIQTLCNTATSYAQTDIIAPGNVADLSAVPGDQYVLLSWTSPGDNNYSGNFSSGAVYEIKYSSLAQISTLNWDDNSIVRPVTELSPQPIIPSPLTALVSEQVLISGLVNFQAYWFALKTSDEVNNVSGISNVPSAVPSPDQTVPSCQLTWVPESKIYMLGNNITVKAIAQDNVAVSTVRLYYRTVGAPTFNYINMYNGSPTRSTGELSAVIPISEITSSGIQYYVEVRDCALNWYISSGQSGIYPSTYTISGTQIDISNIYTETVGISAQTVTVPDGNPSDGNISLSFEAGSVDKNIALSITQLDVSSLELYAGKTATSAFEFGPAAQVFDKAVNLSLLYYDIDEDGIVDGTLFDETDLKLFHWDGINWRKIGGTVNNSENTVSAKIMHFSIYALFADDSTIALKESLPLRKIITPNGDGINDYAEFSGLEIPYELKISNLRGREIRKFNDISSPIWDAKDEDGDIMESGVYIYQLKKDGELISGVIVIAK